MLSGLNDLEVSERIKNGQSNVSIKNPSKSVSEIIISNTFTFFNFVFLVIAIIMISVKLYKSLTFIPLILTNTLIGIYQEIRSKKILDKLTLLNEPKALVLRNGIEENISINDLVIDDIIILKSGNQIPCDAYVLEGEALVNESLLTGEPDEIKKEKDSELLSGSFVVSGKVYAKICNVGSDSYINKLTLEAKKNKKKEDSEIINSLNKILKVISLIIIPFGILLFVEAKYIIPNLNGDFVSVKDAANSTLAALLMMIPEGLYLLATVSLAISAYRLAKDDVLLHNLKSIETLARINVLCIDKTGTITNNDMVVKDYISLDNNLSKEDLFQYISNFSSKQKNDNITMEALKAYFNKECNEDIISITSFSSKYKYSSATFKQHKYVLGAYDLLLKENTKKYKSIIDKYINKGYRILLFALYDGLIDGNALDGTIKPLGLILLSNSIRENAKETFNYFKNQGVDIKVISGDSAKTVSLVAKEAGIDNYDKYIDVSNLSDNELINNVSKYSIFGRVSPHQKLIIIKELKRLGNKVAMTGDGVNDVLALKEADCSVALAQGADAAIQTSQIVLLDSDFKKMPHIVYEGRRVVNNLERSGALFLSKNVFAIILSIICLITLNQFPVKTTQVGLINLFTIGAPAFLLSQVPNKNIIKGKFVINTMSYAIPAGITDAFMVTLIYELGKYINLTQEEISTSATLIMGIVGILIVYNVSRPLNKYKGYCLLICIIGLFLNYLLAFVSPFFKSFYDFEFLPLNGWYLFILLTLLSSFVYIFLAKIISWFVKKTDAYNKVFK